MNLNHKIPPPVIALTCAFIMWFIARFTPIVTLPETLKFIIVGVLCISGLSFDLSALYYFRKAKTTINPLAPSNVSSLVQDGVYRLSRNPMYVGLLFFLLAWAILLQSIASIFVIIIYVVFIRYFQIKPEEEALEQAFGANYLAYKNSVRRWL